VSVFCKKNVRWSSIPYRRWITHFLFLCISACLEIPSTQKSSVRRKHNELQDFKMTAETPRFYSLKKCSQTTIPGCHLQEQLTIILCFSFLHQYGIIYFVILHVFLSIAIRSTPLANLKHAKL